MASNISELNLKKKFPIVSIDSDFVNTPHNFDSLIIVSSDVTKPNVEIGFMNEFLDHLKLYKEYDASFKDSVTFLVPNMPKFGSIKKLIYSPTGPLDRHYDDVRRYADASEKGVKRALQAGSKRILLAVLDTHPNIEGRHIYDLCYEASLLRAAHALYVPLEIREDLPDKAEKVEILGFLSSRTDHDFVLGIEQGRIVCRDIGGSDPERMAAPRIAQYVKSLFSKDSPVKVEIIDDDAVLQKEYPLLSAVNRAAKGVERHRARVIFLTYESNDPVKKTVFLVGKGITYDTGGADIKFGGIMAGMHRDKCGGAAVAGFFQMLDKVRPNGIKVVGAMAVVRNSIGSDAYVSDEIITSRAGLRVRVCNTDAEGRMVMADVLCHMKEKAIDAVNPYIFTIATLTGHAVLAVGEAYSVIADNGPAELENVAPGIQLAGSKIGDMFEVSRIRREDYEFVKGKSEYEDLMQSNNAASSRTPRGHQFPAAFMIMASGLDKHDINSSKPLKYTHIDIAGSSGPFPGIPTGSPIPALSYYFLQ